MAWGNEVWPTGQTAWNTYIEWKIKEYGENSCYVQVKYSSYVKCGDMRGTIVNRSWGGQYRMYGPGWYGDSGWLDVGWVNYGDPVTRECSAWYTGYSGTFRKSTCRDTFRPTAPVWTPQTPTNAKAVRKSQTLNVITWTRNITAARPYDGIYVDRQTDGGEWENIAKPGGDKTEYSDGTVRPNHTYRYRIGAYNTAGNAGGHSYTETLRNPPEKPAAPSDAKVERLSDEKNLVTWANHATDEAPYSEVRIERSTDGGGSVQIAHVSGSATSYTDPTCSADHYYRYLVRAYNESGYSERVMTDRTFNTPSAPFKPSGQRTGDTSVELTIPNLSRTASATEIQRSRDRKDWTTIATVSGKALSFGDNPGGGTFYYRARNLRGSLVSAWSEPSEAVVTICAPAAPTLLTPTSGEVLLVSQGTVTFTWHHNPIDGSAQSAAEVQYSTDGASWKTVTATTAQSASVPNFPLNSTVYWRVRTKGVHADFGPWSGNRSFYVRQSPQLAFDAPGQTVRNVPIGVSVQYVDASGALVAMTVAITDVGGNVLYEESLGTSTSTSVTKDEWMPEDGGEYRIVATARSTSGLQSTASMPFRVEFELPHRASLRIEADAERGYAELKCIVDNNSDGQAVESLSIWRVTRDGERLIASDLSDGSSVVDRYAPLNTEYSYRVAAYAASGASRATEHPGSIKTPYCFVYYGDGLMARAQFDPTEQRNLERANRTLVRYAGREYPVLYDAGGISDTRPLTAHVIGEEEVRAFEDLILYPRAIFKSVAGDVFHVTADVNVNRDLCMPTTHADISLSLTRVDGEAL